MLGIIYSTTVHYSPASSYLPVMHPESSHPDRWEERITLPSIRDMFPDEFARAPHDSPSMGLARLRVSDGDAMMCSDRELPYSYAHPRTRPSVSRPRVAERDDYPPSHSYPSSDSQARQSAAPPLALPTRYSRHSTNRPPYPPGAHPSPYPTTESIQHHAYATQHHAGATDHGLARPMPNSGYAAYQTRPQHAHAQGLPQTYGASHQTARPSSDAPVERLQDDDDRALSLYHQTADLRPQSLEEHPGGVPIPAKYECTYCGKGFNRPSSLKIHLNSHTGEKPFICPVENCGRSFSVLSNMRRHTRVHTQPYLKEAEPSSDESSLNSSPMLVAMQRSHILTGPSTSGSYIPTGSSSHWNHHRSNSMSNSCDSSVISVPSDEEGKENAGPNRPEKRSRHYPE